MNFRSTREFREAMLEALGTTQDKDVENEANYKSALLEALGVEHTRSDVVNFETFREKLVEGVTSKSEGGGGSSDFSTAVVTVNGNGGFVAEVASLTTNGLRGTCFKSPFVDSFTVVLYQGKTIMQVIRATPTFSIPESETNIIYDEDNSWYLITGDCTITIS